MFSKPPLQSFHAGFAASTFLYEKPKIECAMNTTRSLAGGTSGVIEPSTFCTAGFPAVELMLHTATALIPDVDALVEPIEVQFAPLSFVM